MAAATKCSSSLVLGRVVSGTLLTIFFLSVTKFLFLPLVLPPSCSGAIPTWIPLSALLALLVPFLIYNYSEKKMFTNYLLPPGPLSLPVVGNWLQVGNDLNHRFLASLAARYGEVFLLRLGVRNLVVVSDPDLAAQVLHTQGVEFGSRPRNVVFDIFTGNGQDMVFTVYGDHWRKMRRIMTLPFFTNKVVQQYREMWEQEMDLAVADLQQGDGEYWGAKPEEGVVVRRRLQLMLYNIMYMMMFDARFESVADPLFRQATQFNSERSRLAQSFEYNYGDFILRRRHKTLRNPLLHDGSAGASGPVPEGERGGSGERECRRERGGKRKGVKKYFPGLVNGSVSFLTESKLRGYLIT